MIDKYLNTYIDRRMKLLIEEWQLATKAEVRDYSARIDTLCAEITRLDGVERNALGRLESLEARAKRVEALLK